MNIESAKPKKQRKFKAMLPLHLKRKQLSSHLSKELRKGIGRRAVEARKGDKAKVLRGDFRGKEGKIVRVDVARQKLFIEKLVRKKADGTEKLVPFNASNLLLVELERSDDRRFRERKGTGKMNGKKEKEAGEVKAGKKEEKTEGKK
ncbi:MAG: 50S ribosomal protein L24 [Candidatus Diapherotrites archaeon]